MNTKMDNLLISKNSSFDNNNKININNSKNNLKNTKFKDNIESFTTKRKKESEYKSKNKFEEQDNIKINKKQAKIEIKESTDSIKEDDKETENLEIQNYLVSLFKKPIKSGEIIDFEETLIEKDISELNINIELTNMEEDVELNLSEGLKNVMLSDEIEDLNSKLSSGNNEIKSNLGKILQAGDEKENNDLLEKLNINNKEVKTDINLESEKENEEEVKLKPFYFENSQVINDEDKTEEINSQKLDNSNMNKDVEKDIGDKHGSKDVNIETEDLDTIKPKIDLKDNIFSIEKKAEINLINDLETAVKELEPIDTKETIKHIAEQMKFSINNNKNQIKINLKPETLGELTMEIEVIKGALTAKIMVDNYKAKEMIQNNLFQLKEEIKDTGLEIKSFEVFVNNGNDFSKQGREHLNFNQFNKKNRNNASMKKLLNEKDNIGYVDNSDFNSETNKYIEGSLNLFA